MPPTQATRLDDLEETVAALQGEVPELRETMEERFKDLKNCVEESQAKVDDSVKEQKNITAVLVALTTEVKAISSKLGERREENTPISIPERSVLEQERSNDGETMAILEEFRQSVERNRERGNYNVRKLDFPIFSGDDPDGWVGKVERYFEVYQLSEKEKLGAASLGLEGDALSWFHWEKKRRTIPNWQTLRRMILKHFRGRKGGSLMEQWMSIRQEGSVEDYEKEFIQFAANLEEEVSESCLLANFIKGLEWRIQTEFEVDGSCECR